MPLALPTLAALAPGHEYTLIDELRGDRIDFDAPCDLVGISVRFTSESRAYEVAGQFRNRGVPVVLGGPQASAVPLAALEHANAVVVGEAEELWPVVVADAERNALRDLYVCSPRDLDAPGKSVYQVRTHPGLAGLPRPARHLMGKGYAFGTTYAARGCPIDCEFCSVTELFGSATRLRPMDEVIADIGSLGRHYYLLDDTVFGRPAVYDYYLELYGRLARGRRRQFWTGQANLGAVADARGREVVKAAARAGLVYAAIGMESVDPATLVSSGALAKMGAGSSDDVIERMKEHVRFIQDQGIVVSGWFVVGYDGESPDAPRRISDFCRELDILPVIFPVKALPGTRLHDRLVREGRLSSLAYTGHTAPGIDDPVLRDTLRGITRRAYSAPSILRRTLFYAGRFGDHRIHKIIFTLALQTRLRRGVTVWEAIEPNA